MLQKRLERDVVFVVICRFVDVHEQNGQETREEGFRFLRRRRRRAADEESFPDADSSFQKLDLWKAGMLNTCIFIITV